MSCSPRLRYAAPKALADGSENLLCAFLDCLIHLRSLPPMEEEQLGLYVANIFKRRLKHVETTFNRSMFGDR
jgi:hypothetical protein